MKVPTQEIEAAILLDSLGENVIADWAEDINSKRMTDYLRTSGKFAFKVDGISIFKAKGDFNTIYFVPNTDYMYGKYYEIVFYAQVQKSTSRNKMFKAGGMHQSLIWKDPLFSYSTPGFSIKFMTALLSRVNTLLMTDMKQTKYGSAMWVNLLNTLYKTYDCYYALSAPSDAKCIIKIETADDIAKHYVKDIVKKGTGYAYRTAFILKKGTDPRTVLRDPDKTLILTCQEAEELGAFITPSVLTELEENRMLDEYNGIEK